MRVLVGMLFAVFMANGCAGCADLGDPTNRSCGNELREDREVCDGTDLAGKTCASLGYASGELACALGCGGFVVAQCVGAGERIDVCSDCSPAEQCEQNQCVPICEAPGWTTATTLDIDVAVVDQPISIRYAADPASWASDELQGRLVFYGELPWAPQEVEVAPGQADVEVPMFAGSYDVAWHRGDDDGASIDLGTVEVGGTPIAFELPTWSAMTGTVSLGESELGEVLTAARFGGLVFDRVDGTAEPVRADIRADGTYEIWLRAGEHHVWWARDKPFPAVAYVGEVALDGDDERPITLPFRMTEFQLSVEPPVPGMTGVGKAVSLRLDDLAESPAPRLPGTSIWDLTSVELDENLTGRTLVREGLHTVRVQLDTRAIFGSVQLGEVDTSDGPVVVELSLVPVSGEVLRNGRRLPNTGFSGSRGLVHFEDPNVGLLNVPISESGAGVFDAWLPAGTWSIDVAGNYWTQLLPVVPERAHEGLVVTNDAVDDIELDIAATQLTGIITANGARLPDETTGERGVLQIQREGESIWHALPLAPTGPAAFSVVVSPGSYAFGVTRWWFGTGDDPPSGFLPFGEWVAGPVEIEQATRRDIDVRLYEVAIEVGGDAIQPGGTVWFEDRRTHRAARILELTDGTATRETTLYPGHYRVGYENPDGTALVLDNSLVIDADTSLSYQRQVVTVTGRVTRAGEEVMTAVGELLFEPVPSSDGTLLRSSVGGTGQFEAKLPEGTYNVYLNAESAEWPPQTHPVRWSCASGRALE